MDEESAMVRFTKVIVGGLEMAIQAGSPVCLAVIIGLLTVSSLAKGQLTPAVVPGGGQGSYSITYSGGTSTSAGQYGSLTWSYWWGSGQTGWGGWLHRRAGVPGRA